jgi:hypothetical protein
MVIPQPMTLVQQPRAMKLSMMASRLDVELSKLYSCAMVASAPAEMPSQLGQHAATSRDAKIK